MKIKKFLAPSMQEALKMIKKEFGDDAIILSNKSVQ
ncbi:MAG TPA: flagellar biosynthesis regulator FlhF, partial [Candidatus Cloacimonadota bacterium]|nr:flagellar biosynthesis regulator FlhF [Candidatus Cloacimonadota bacterium]